MQQVLRDGDVYQKVTVESLERAHFKKIRRFPVLYSLGSDWNECQETTQHGFHCICQELVPIGMKGTLIACYLQLHLHQ